MLSCTIALLTRLKFIRMNNAYSTFDPTQVGTDVRLSVNPGNSVPTKKLIGLLFVVGLIAMSLWYKNRILKKKLSDNTQL